MNGAMNTIFALNVNIMTMINASWKIDSVEFPLSSIPINKYGNYMCYFADFVADSEV